MRVDESVSVCESVHLEESVHTHRILWLCSIRKGIPAPEQRFRNSFLKSQLFVSKLKYFIKKIVLLKWSSS